MSTDNNTPEPVAIGFVISEMFGRKPEVQAAMARLKVGPLPEPVSNVETPQEAAHRLDAAARNRKARWERRLPRKWAEASLDDLDDQQDPGGRVSGWWGIDSPTLLLHSQIPGVGKTHAAYAVGKHAVDTGASAEAWPVLELLMAMRPEGDPTALPNAVAADLLVLDDIGKESQSDFTRQQLHLILDARLVQGRRTVVTTNLTYDQMVARYDASLVDRLTDDAVIVKFEGQSRRKPKPLW